MIKAFRNFLADVLSSMGAFIGAFANLFQSLSLSVREVCIWGEVEENDWAPIVGTSLVK